MACLELIIEEPNQTRFLILMLCAALMGSIISGPRLGKFLKGGIATRFENASSANMVLGVLILWLGW